ncbi:hypothetical protein [Microbacterium sp. CIAB417]|uniref:hypothetical protein n=1 Tax=Microbacterium sp. CIAB417 TaxID=2860287 RepID=UPI001FAD0CA7|nr:hypothetical protein [Microbacterium sp. CIAB417]
MLAPAVRRSTAALSTCTLALALTGCLGTVPVDPDGTLDAARGGTLRIGVSLDPGLAEAGRDGPTGPLVDLAEGYAESIDARIDWVPAGEETLVGMLEEGEVDLAVGGFSADTPWADRVGATRGYADLPGLDGRTVVWLVPAGENALLSDIELYLDGEAGS